jgi:hypothetical protein
MQIVIIILALLLLLGAPTLGIMLLIKRKGAAAGQIIGPLGPRRRDGALTFNEYRGIRSNVQVEDPRPGQSARYQRRHAARQRQQAKPWMK